MVDHLALLRGINVGGRNKLAMASLVAIFEEAGCDNVRTYIQSGNVLFGSPPDTAARIPDLVTAAVAKRFGYRTPVVTRTATQLRDVVLRNPFLGTGADPRALHVLFLRGEPDQDRVAGLDPQRSPGDRFVVSGQDVYLELPNGVARSKLTAEYFDAELATMSTQRNWRTVTKLLDLMEH